MTYTLEDALAEIDRLRAWIGVYEANTDEWERLLAKMKAQREETEQLVQRMAERLAAYENGLVKTPDTAPMH